MLDETESAPEGRPSGPPPVSAPGPISQSVVIGFRAIFIATGLLLLIWLMSNVREIAPDSQAVIMRFGRIVRTQQAGLLVAWPQPIGQVRLLPGPDRQLSQDVGALPPESEKAAAVISAPDSQALPGNVAAYLTGDGNIVVLNATLIYRINDPPAFALEESHVGAALDRVFRATTVRIAAGRNLNDFLVVQTEDSGDKNPQAIIALRGEVRASLLADINSRLQQLSISGSSLGVEVQRIDMTAWLPPDAKTAFDAVLTATQAADRGVAVAHTEAERRRQEADRERGRLLSGAQATAQELIAAANVDTAAIIAIEREETPDTRTSLLLQAYRSRIAVIMNRIGAVTLIDPQSGVRVVLPGKQK
jgi:regulator of protease activity HflC (stomatin/prohibitin superfamily)